MLCDSGDSSTHALCPLARNVNFETLQSRCELDIVGKRCGGDEECVNAGLKEFQCDFGVCTKAFRFGILMGHLGSCDIDDTCSITSVFNTLLSRCVLADEGINRCLQERQIGASCAPVRSLGFYLR